MPSFGKKSLERLSQCHPDLQIIAEELIKIMDVIVLCGHRNEEDQNKAFKDGKSQLEWPNSKHNTLPSDAVDMAPYPVVWTDIDRFKEMCTYIEKIAQDKGIKIRLGRDFSFKDYPHIELA